MLLLSSRLRIACCLIGISSLMATALLIISREPIQNVQGSVLETSWALLRYFTILTNFIVSWVLLRAAYQGHWKSFSLLTASAVWIFLVAVIYHILLSSGHNPESTLAIITNHIHHTIVPLGTVLIWLSAQNRQFISWKSPFIWLIFPLLYTVYSILRAEVLGDFYPYPFIDPHNPDIGWLGFTKAQGLLVLTFLATGILFRIISNWRLNDISRRA